MYTQPQGEGVSVALWPRLPLRVISRSHQLWNPLVSPSPGPLCAAWRVPPTPCEGSGENPASRGELPRPCPLSPPSGRGSVQGPRTPTRRSVGAAATEELGHPDTRATDCWEPPRSLRCPREPHAGRPAGSPPVLPRRAPSPRAAAVLRDATETAVTPPGHGKQTL